MPSRSAGGFHLLIVEIARPSPQSTRSKFPMRVRMTSARMAAVSDPPACRRRIGDEKGLVGTPREGILDALGRFGDAHGNGQDGSPGCFLHAGRFLQGVRS